MRIQTRRRSVKGTTNSDSVNKIQNPVSGLLGLNPKLLIQFEALNSNCKVLLPSILSGVVARCKLPEMNFKILFFKICLLMGKDERHFFS